MYGHWKMRRACCFTKKKPHIVSEIYILQHLQNPPHCFFVVNFFLICYQPCCMIFLVLQVL